jgi:hypothetical protein
MTKCNVYGTCCTIGQASIWYLSGIQPEQPSYQTSYLQTVIYGLTAWIAAASLLTLSDVIPATEILPSLVA